jgi:hypothetical protein
MGVGRGGAMLEYRLYFLDSDGHITSPPAIVRCEDDRAAIMSAEQLLEGKAIEIWQGARLITRIQPKHPE